MALISHRMIQMFNSTINMNDQIRHHYNPCNFKVSTTLFQESLGPSWSYGTWIYNLQWVPITTNVVTSNPAYDEVYSIHHYVIKFVRDWNIVTSDVKQHNPKAKKKYMCVYCHISKKSRVGRSGLIFFFFFIIGKTGNSRSRFRNPIPVFHFRNFW